MQRWHVCCARQRRLSYGRNAQRAGRVGVSVPRVRARRARHRPVTRMCGRRQALRELGGLGGRNLLGTQVQAKGRDVQCPVLIDRQGPGRGVGMLGIIGQHQRDRRARALDPHSGQQPCQAVRVARCGRGDQHHVRRPHVAGSRAARIQHTQAGLSKGFLNVVDLLAQFCDRGIDAAGVGEPVRVDFGDLAAEADHRHLQHLRPGVVRQLAGQEPGQVQAAFPVASERQRPDPFQV
jgi:hypothetical protein